MSTSAGPSTLIASPSGTVFTNPVWAFAEDGSSWSLTFTGTYYSWSTSFGVKIPTRSWTNTHDNNSASNTSYFTTGGDLTNAANLEPLVSATRTNYPLNSTNPNCQFYTITVTVPSTSPYFYVNDMYTTKAWNNGYANLTLWMRLGDYTLTLKIIPPPTLLSIVSPSALHLHAGNNFSINKTFNYKSVTKSTLVFYAFKVGTKPWGTNTDTTKTTANYTINADASKIISDVQFSYTANAAGSFSVNIKVSPSSTLAVSGGLFDVYATDNAVYYPSVLEPWTVPFVNFGTFSVDKRPTLNSLATMVPTNTTWRTDSGKDGTTKTLTVNYYGYDIPLTIKALPANLDTYSSRAVITDVSCTLKTNGRTVDSTGINTYIDMYNLTITGGTLSSYGGTFQLWVYSADISTPIKLGSVFSVLPPTNSLVGAYNFMGGRHFTSTSKTITGVMEYAPAQGLIDYDPITKVINGLTFQAKVGGVLTGDISAVGTYIGSNTKILLTVTMTDSAFATRSLAPNTTNDIQLYFSDNNTTLKSIYLPFRAVPETTSVVLTVGSITRSVIGGAADNQSAALTLSVTGTTFSSSAQRAFYALPPEVTVFDNLRVYGDIYGTYTSGTPATLKLDTRNLNVVPTRFSIWATDGTFAPIRIGDSSTTFEVLKAVPNESAPVNIASVTGGVIQRSITYTYVSESSIPTSYVAANNSSQNSPGYQTSLDLAGILVSFTEGPRDAVLKTVTHYLTIRISPYTSSFPETRFYVFGKFGDGSAANSIRYGTVSFHYFVAQTFSKISSMSMVPTSYTLNAANGYKQLIGSVTTTPSSSSDTVIRDSRKFRVSPPLSYISVYNNGPDAYYFYVEVTGTPDATNPPFQVYWQDEVTAETLLPTTFTVDFTAPLSLINTFTSTEWTANVPFTTDLWTSTLAVYATGTTPTSATFSSAKIASITTTYSGAAVLVSVPAAATAYYNNTTTIHLWSLKGSTVTDLGLVARPLFGNFTASSNYVQNDTLPFTWALSGSILNYTVANAGTLKLVTMPIDITPSAADFTANASNTLFSGNNAGSVAYATTYLSVTDTSLTANGFTLWGYSSLAPSAYVKMGTFAAPTVTNPWVSVSQSSLTLSKWTAQCPTLTSDATIGAFKDGDIPTSATFSTLRLAGVEVDKNGAQSALVTVFSSSAAYAEGGTYVRLWSLNGTTVTNLGLVPRPVVGSLTNVSNVRNSLGIWTISGALLEYSAVTSATITLAAVSIGSNPSPSDYSAVSSLLTINGSSTATSTTQTSLTLTVKSSTLDSGFTLWGQSSEYPSTDVNLGTFVKPINLNLQVSSLTASAWTASGNVDSPGAFTSVGIFDAGTIPTFATFSSLAMTGVTATLTTPELVLSVSLSAGSRGYASAYVDVWTVDTASSTVKYLVSIKRPSFGGFASSSTNPVGVLLEDVANTWSFTSTLLEYSNASSGTITFAGFPVGVVPTSVGSFSPVIGTAVTSSASLVITDEALKTSAGCNIWAYSSLDLTTFVNLGLVYAPLRLALPYKLDYIYAPDTARHYWKAWGNISALQGTNLQAYPIGTQPTDATWATSSTAYVTASSTGDVMVTVTSSLSGYSTNPTFNIWKRTGSAAPYTYTYQGFVSRPIVGSLLAPNSNNLYNKITNGVWTIGGTLNASNNDFTSYGNMTLGVFPMNTPPTARWSSGENFVGIAGNAVITTSKVELTIDDSVNGAFTSSGFELWGILGSSVGNYSFILLGSFVKPKNLQTASPYVTATNVGNSNWSVKAPVDYLPAGTFAAYPVGWKPSNTSQFSSLNLNALTYVAITSTSSPNTITCTVSFDTGYNKQFEVWCLEGSTMVYYGRVTQPVLRGFTSSPLNNLPTAANNNVWSIQGTVGSSASGTIALLPFQTTVDPVDNSGFSNSNNATTANVTSTYSIFSVTVNVKELAVYDANACNIWAYKAEDPYTLVKLGGPYTKPAALNALWFTRGSTAWTAEKQTTLDSSVTTVNAFTTGTTPTAGTFYTFLPGVSATLSLDKVLKLTVQSSASAAIFSGSTTVDIWTMVGTTVTNLGTVYIPSFGAVYITNGVGSVANDFDNTWTPSVTLMGGPPNLTLGFFSAAFKPTSTTDFITQPANVSKTISTGSIALSVTNTDLQQNGFTLWAYTSANTKVFVNLGRFDFPISLASTLSTQVGTIPSTTLNLSNAWKTTAHYTLVARLKAVGTISFSASNQSGVAFSSQDIVLEGRLSAATLSVSLPVNSSLRVNGGTVYISWTDLYTPKTSWLTLTIPAPSVISPQSSSNFELNVLNNWSETLTPGLLYSGSALNLLVVKSGGVEPTSENYSTLLNDSTISVVVDASTSSVTASVSGEPPLDTDSFGIWAWDDNTYPVRLYTVNVISKLTPSAPPALLYLQKDNLWQVEIPFNRPPLTGETVNFKAVATDIVISSSSEFASAAAYAPSGVSVVGQIADGTYKLVVAANSQGQLSGGSFRVWGLFTAGTVEEVILGTSVISIAQSTVVTGTFNVMQNTINTFVVNLKLADIQFSSVVPQTVRVHAVSSESNTFTEDVAGLTLSVVLVPDNDSIASVYLSVPSNVYSSIRTTALPSIKLWLEDDNTLPIKISNKLYSFALPSAIKVTSLSNANYILTDDLPHELFSFVRVGSDTSAFLLHALDAGATTYAAGADIAGCTLTVQGPQEGGVYTVSAQATSAVFIQDATMRAFKVWMVGTLGPSVAHITQFFADAVSAAVPYSKPSDTVELNAANQWASASVALLNAPASTLRAVAVAVDVTEVTFNPEQALPGVYVSFSDNNAIVVQATPMGTPACVVSSLAVWVYHSDQHAPPTKLEVTYVLAPAILSNVQVLTTGKLVPDITKTVTLLKFVHASSAPLLLEARAVTDNSVMQGVTLSVLNGVLKAVLDDSVIDLTYFHEGNPDAFHIWASDDAGTTFSCVTTLQPFALQVPESIIAVSLTVTDYVLNDFALYPVTVGNIKYISSTPTGALIVKALPASLYTFSESAALTDVTFVTTPAELENELTLKVVVAPTLWQTSGLPTDKPVYFKLWAYDATTRAQCITPIVAFQVPVVCSTVISSQKLERTVQHYALLHVDYAGSLANLSATTVPLGGVLSDPLSGVGLQVDASTSEVLVTLDTTTFTDAYFLDTEHKTQFTVWLVDSTKPSLAPIQLGDVFTILAPPSSIEVVPFQTPSAQRALRPAGIDAAITEIGITADTVMPLPLLSVNYTSSTGVNILQVVATAADVEVFNAETTPQLPFLTVVQETSTSASPTFVISVKVNVGVDDIVAHYNRRMKFKLWAFDANTTPVQLGLVVALNVPSSITAIPNGNDTSDVRIRHVDGEAIGATTLADVLYLRDDSGENLYFEVVAVSAAAKEYTTPLAGVQLTLTAVPDLANTYTVTATFGEDVLSSNGIPTGGVLSFYLWGSDTRTAAVKLQTSAPFVVSGDIALHKVITAEIGRPSSADVMLAVAELKYWGNKKNTLQAHALALSDVYDANLIVPGITVTLDATLSVYDVSTGTNVVRVWMTVDPELFNSTTDVIFGLWAEDEDIAPVRLGHADFILSDVVMVERVMDNQGVDITDNTQIPTAYFYPDHDARLESNPNMIEIAKVRVRGGRTTTSAPYTVYLMEVDGGNLAEGCEVLQEADGLATILHVYYDVTVGAPHSSRNESFSRNITLTVADATHRTVSTTIRVVSVSNPQVVFMYTESTFLYELVNAYSISSAETDKDFTLGTVSVFDGLDGFTYAPSYRTSASPLFETKGSELIAKQPISRSQSLLTIPNSDVYISERGRTFVIPYDVNFYLYPAVENVEFSSTETIVKADSNLADTPILVEFTGGLGTYTTSLTVTSSSSLPATLPTGFVPNGTPVQLETSVATDANTCLLTGLSAALDVPSAGTTTAAHFALTASVTNGGVTVQSTVQREVLVYTYLVSVDSTMEAAGATVLYVDATDPSGTVVMPASKTVAGGYLPVTVSLVQGSGNFQLLGNDVQLKTGGTSNTVLQIRLTDAYGVFEDSTAFTVKWIRPASLTAPAGPVGVFDSTTVSLANFSIADADVSNMDFFHAEFSGVIPAADADVWTVANPSQSTWTSGTVNATFALEEALVATNVYRLAVTATPLPLEEEQLAARGGFLLSSTGFYDDNDNVTAQLYFLYFGDRVFEVVPTDALFDPSLTIVNFTAGNAEEIDYSPQTASGNIALSSTVNLAPVDTFIHNTSTEGLLRITSLQTFDRITFSIVPTGSSEEEQTAVQFHSREAFVGSVINAHDVVLADIVAIAVSAMPAVVTTYDLVATHHVVVDEEGLEVYIQSSIIATLRARSAAAVTSVAISRSTDLSKQFPDCIRMTLQTVTTTTGVQQDSNAAVFAYSLRCQRVAWNGAVHWYELATNVTDTGITTGISLNDIDRILEAQEDGAGWPERDVTVDASVDFSNTSVWLQYALFVQNVAVFSPSSVEFGFVQSNIVNIVRDQLKTPLQYLDYRVSPSSILRVTVLDNDVFDETVQYYSSDTTVLYEITNFGRQNITRALLAFGRTLG